MRRDKTNRTQLIAVLLSTVLAVSIIGAVAFLPVAAEHPDDAPDYTGDAFFEVSAVSQSDHYPGQQEGSMRYEAGGSQAFKDQNAEEGVWIDYIIIDSYYDGEQWIDYTNCNTENTAAFGIDRGNDNEGTNYDEDLVQKQKRADFRQDGITVEFYNHDDFGGNPPYMAPEDAIVAQQGEGSAGGPCLQMTEEPGWYRIQGFLNGTVADNGEDQAPSDDAEQVSVAVQSTWFYVCDCESEEEAREKLGPPPGEEGSNDGGDESTPSGDDESTPSGDETTATATESGGGGGESTATESGGGGSGATATESGGGGSGATATESGGGGGESTATESGGGGSGATATESGGAGNQTDAGNQTGGGQAPGDDQGTPTANDGPGFGALAALLALFGSALLLTRRW